MATIVKLPDHTIRMIAAGEVITRPVNVVKELLENSLDAGSTNIRINIEQGGVKLIEIIDNGHGIARANADLLCHRYATSKLRLAVDLLKISTFGFRGEALSSISEMADLEVTTFNIKTDKMGWQAKYKHGKLESPPVDKYVQNVGTQLKVNNLFSTIFQRKAAIQTSFLEEKKSIIELIVRYAIHHRDRVTLSLKEGNSQDIICVIAPMEIGPCVGMFYGIEVENNMIDFEVKNVDKFKAKAYIAFSYKKSTGASHHSHFILFVNDRLVDCSDLKREVEAQASEHLNLKQHVSFFYIALEVPPADVDVNTHPAKATVALHYQVEIIAMIVNALRDQLKANLATQLVQSNPTPVRQKSIGLILQKTPAKRQFDLVHNDASQQSLLQMTSSRPSERVNLRSIHDLRQQVAKEKCSYDTARTIKNSVFVGLFDHDRALIQNETKLYAINLKSYLKEQYYQFYLYDFANFPPIEIVPPGNRIRFIIETYLEDIKKHETKKFLELKFNTIQTIIDELLKHAQMFEDYLNLRITKEEIITLPCIMPDEVPNLAFLGKFLVDMVNIVDYQEERECLRMIGRVIADFYSEAPANLKDKDIHRRYHDLIETKLYVAIKSYLLIPEWLFTKENICQISDTKDLYKVFERC